MPLVIGSAHFILGQKGHDVPLHLYPPPPPQNIRKKTWTKPLQPPSTRSEVRNACDNLWYPQREAPYPQKKEARSVTHYFEH